MPADPVASGVPFEVRDVGGRTPRSLNDFTGVLSFTVVTGDGVHGVSGVGSIEGDTVRFQEKDLDHEGKDVRVWEIAAGGDNGFTAQHAAAF